MEDSIVGNNTRNLGSTLLPLMAVCSTLASGAALAQTEEAAVLKTVDAFFAAMTDRDGEALRKLTIQGSLNIWTANPPEARELNLINYTQLINRFSGAGPRMVERYWDPTVLIEGNIALFWAPYDFHVDGNFSHCGIDSFQLVKREGSWLLSNLSWTRQYDNCAPSPLGPLRQDSRQARVRD